MNRAQIMRASNQLIEALLFYSDGDFVDDVVQHVVDGVTFDEEDISAAEEEL